ncbi:hypothetical protein GJ654_18710 [Rhodoblastus acidophilus]|uniref:Uncharacterized protein n=1 Tax=Rhodoblastus acidophilus TaxID=1074 RepID=A0A6N8DTX2_RHOAC|nr:hypothetical protein [Rhodoblastus acidophilus]MCW2276360.1 hypothetical protein [Rhodoblastus acidophilus]MTV33015.1 hypothetical protein [Rhodoblastus acidophilus]
MSELPARRPALTFEFFADPATSSHPAVATVGFLADGRPGEIFINAVKRDQFMDHLIRDTGVLLSYALQLGCDFDRLRAGVTRDACGKAQGIAGAALDALAGMLESGDGAAA